MRYDALCIAQVRRTLLAGARVAKETAKDRQSNCKELQLEYPAAQAWMPLAERHSGCPGVHLYKLACKNEHRLTQL
jgi:hypothetical protein